MSQWGEAAHIEGYEFWTDFGKHVAVEGDLLFAEGAVQFVGPVEDRASIFELVAGAWNLVDNQDILGIDVQADISSGTLVLSNLNSGNGVWPEVYVFEEVAGSWMLLQEIIAPPTADDLVRILGVAVGGDTMMLLASPANDFSQNYVNVFRRAGFNWSFEARLTIPGGAYAGNVRGIDIHGDVAVAGATVLRDGLSGWSVQTTLSANDGAILGAAVAVSDGVIVQGAPFHEAVNGRELSGAAYVFEEDSSGTWIQSEQLTPAQSKAQAFFGRSIAMSGQTIVIGEPNRTVSGKDRSGLAYVFQKLGPDWNNVAVLSPSDGAGLRNQFGWDVDISGGLIAVGAPGWGTVPDPDPDGNTFIDGPGAVYIYGCALDTDGDGLCDDWETGGIPYYDEFGDLQHYMLPGADPLRKDLYVEVDVMAGVPFDQGAIDDVVAAFANAPVTNADPSTGITLHVLVDEMDLPFDEEWSDNFLDFDASKELHFGTTIEHANDELLKAKALAYRYCQWVNKFAPSGAVGWGELRGNDFTVAFGGLPVPAQTRDMMASTWMHELGHNLNLQHGGADSVNYKPNHVSVMNYAFDDYVKLVGTDLVSLPVDFSREATQAILESSLNEQTGITSTLYSDVLTFFTTGDSLFPSEQIALDGTPIDYDFDDQIDTELVQQDLNNFDGSGQLEALIVHNEWDLIILGLGGDGDYLDRQHTTLPPSELDVATVQLLDDAAAIAFNDCPPDLDGDGVVDGSDLAALLAAWGAAGSPADLNGDGVVDGADLATLLAAWGGC